MVRYFISIKCIKVNFTGLFFGVLKLELLLLRTLIYNFITSKYVKQCNLHFVQSTNFEACDKPSYSMYK